jgi:hypothetical protein
LAVSYITVRNRSLDVDSGVFVVRIGGAPCSMYNMNLKLEDFASRNLVRDGAFAIKKGFDV